MPSHGTTKKTHRKTKKRQDDHSSLYLFIFIIVLIFVAAIIGLIIYLALNKKPKPQPGPDPNNQGGTTPIVYILGPGPEATGGIDPIQSTYYSDSPFTSGDVTADPALNTIIGQLQSQVDESTTVASQANIEANLSSLQQTAGFYSGASMAPGTQNPDVIITNYPAQGQVTPTSPEGFYGSPNSFVFIYGIPPSTSWVQKVLLPTYTVNINQKTVMPNSN